jgi:ribosomal protein L37AE/L43A
MSNNSGLIILGVVGAVFLVYLISQSKGASASIRGECVCPKCGTVVAHEIRVPCQSVACPKCGTAMIRR